MGLINPAPGVVDFGGFRALQPLYDAAKAAGIWIVLRPGDLSLSSFSVVMLIQVYQRTCQFLCSVLRYSRLKQLTVCLFLPLQVHQCRDLCRGYCSLGNVGGSRSTALKRYRLESCLARLHSRNYQRNYSQPNHSWRTRDRSSLISRHIFFHDYLTLFWYI